MASRRPVARQTATRMGRTRETTMIRAILTLLIMGLLGMFVLGLLFSVFMPLLCSRSRSRRFWWSATCCCGWSAPATRTGFATGSGTREAADGAGLTRLPALAGRRTRPFWPHHLFFRRAGALSG